MTAAPGSAWIDLVHQLGKDFAQRAADHDNDDSFVEQNYADLKKHRFFAATVPEALGGVSHSQMCDILHTLAGYCSSTALALSMHQHLLAANIWKYKRGQGAEEMLKKVADSQPVLVSTGARDWLESNGEVERTDGGYLVSAIKHFASQSAVGDVLVTSAPFSDPDNGWQVLHFPVPFRSEGVQPLRNWRAMGMRGTGSHTVKLENVFVPKDAIVLTRPQGEFHPFWHVVLTVAMPLIMSVYAGIARKAAEMAIEGARGNKDVKSHVPLSVGAMHNDLTAAETQWRDMVRIANDLDFDPSEENAQAILSRKTNVANACISTVEKAMEVVGGPGLLPLVRPRAALPRRPGRKVSSAPGKGPAPVHRRIPAQALTASLSCDLSLVNGHCSALSTDSRPPAAGLRQKAIP